jgi:hypothetical protein
MDEYVRIFGWITMGLDVLLLTGCCYCVYYNAKYLIDYAYKIQDVSFRTLMLGLTVAYSLANSEALKRHIDTFLYRDGFKLTEDMVDSLLSDRSFMLITGMFVLALTLKFRTNMYDK